MNTVNPLYGKNFASPLASESYLILKMIANGHFIFTQSPDALL